MKEGHLKPIYPGGEVFDPQPSLETHKDVVVLFGPQLGPRYRRLIWQCLDRENLLLEKGTLPPAFVTLDQHDASQARYLFDYVIEKPDGVHRVLASVLRPGAATTRHQHSFVEDYYVLVGEISLEGHSVAENTSYHVSPWEFHQVTAKENPALMIIVMRNAGNIPKEEQYIDRQSPNGTAANLSGILPPNGFIQIP